jgi:two-component system, chemotaxis family, protein-glutamate methylesterase/glutaminase
MFERMQGHDIIAIGASAGGVEALTGLVRVLPADLPASIFVVLHTWPRGTSYLPSILRAAGALKAVHPEDNTPIERGMIYVAPPDFHLMVEPGRVRIVKGPRENRTRPAIDPLFRSAARAYGPRVVGVVLSGTLDDGSSGLIAIKRRGGVAIVQDPDEAAFNAMPASALLAVKADFCLPVREIAHKLADLAVTPSAKPTAEQEAAIVEPSEFAERDVITPEQERAMGAPSAFTCPECNGTLWEARESGLVRFKCRVGHAYSAGSMLSEQTDAVERAVWAAVRALEENAALGLHLAEEARLHRNAKLAAKYEARARESRRHSKQLHRLLMRRAGNGDVERSVQADTGE